MFRCGMTTAVNCLNSVHINLAMRCSTGAVWIDTISLPPKVNGITRIGYLRFGYLHSRN